MTVRKLDPTTNDIVTSGVQFISEREEIAQTIKTRLRLFFGEYFRDVNDGTRWWEDVLGKGQGEPAREAAIKRRIAQTDGVVQIVKYDSDFNIQAREYSISAEVLTPFGQITVVFDGGTAIG